MRGGSGGKDQFDGKTESSKWGRRSPACWRSAHTRWAVLAGVTPRSFGVLGLTFQFPGVLKRCTGGRLTGADQASTAAGGDDRFGCGSPVQARPGGGSGVVVVPTLAVIKVRCVSFSLAGRRSKFGPKSSLHRCRPLRSYMYAPLPPWHLRHFRSLSGGPSQPRGRA